jgi:hypothetical protein
VATVGLTPRQTIRDTCVPPPLAEEGDGDSPGGGCRVDAPCRPPGRARVGRYGAGVPAAGVATGRTVEGLHPLTTQGEPPDPMGDGGSHA